MRIADVRRWALGALGIVIGVTAAEAGPILLPAGDPGTEISDEAKLSILFHYRYDDVTIPDAWLRRVTPVAPPSLVTPPAPSSIVAPQTPWGDPLADLAPLSGTPGAAFGSPGAATGTPGVISVPASDPTPTAAIPEPSTLLLVGLGAVGLLARRRKPAA